MKAATRSLRTDVAPYSQWSSVTFDRPSRRFKRSSVDGYRFVTARQVERYGELRRLVDAGDIWGLQVHPGFVFRLNGVQLANYQATFAYCLRLQFKQIVEDVREHRPREWPIHKRLMQAFFDIEVREL